MSAKEASRAARAAGEPVAFGSAVRELLDERGWQAEAAGASVLSRWESLVGAEVAAHCRPVRLRDGELVIEAERTAWATQLRLLSRSSLAGCSESWAPTWSASWWSGADGPDWRHGGCG